MLTGPELRILGDGGKVATYDIWAKETMAASEGGWEKR